MNICFQYILKSYFKRLFSVLFITALVIYLTNSFELLGRFRDHKPLFLLQLSGLKLPYLISEISPLICMLSVLWLVNNLVKQNEFIIFFNNCISIRRIIKYLVLINLCFSLFLLLFISPISSRYLAQYDQTIDYLRGYDVSRDNLFFKLKGEKFIHIESLRNNLLSGITIAEVQANDLKRTTFCSLGRIKQAGQWNLEDCDIKDGNVQTHQDNYILQTNVKKKDIRYFEYSPYHLPFWNLPNLVVSLQKLGMPSSFVELYFYKQITRPLVVILFSLMPFFFFDLEKHKIWLNSSYVIVASFTGFLFLSVIANILTHYTNSAVLCSIVPIAVFLFFILFRISHI
ncbi:hypothetical protein phytr_9000 [Candidatus Phycorickettsia trachydisci]|uniref:Permease n=1 Tax=Candidatus Phycorickettsia trachydisci TaxID=2115978 RepID=A0A2P1P994_9RICK|nr:LptF/LptG family permease [Candidatus Phycorickettsia trachydisci]AVP87830.1 hypothetical protein phytr_9000 [Candidatus Phycorickettsia trachydisci]